MTGARITLVQMARLGDLAQTWLLVLRLRGSGARVKLVVEENLRSLAEIMVGKDNVFGVDTGLFRRTSPEKGFLPVIAGLAESIRKIDSDYVINLNFHSAIAGLAETIPAKRRGGARWRDIDRLTPSDKVFKELFLSSSAEGRLTTRHLSEIWGGYGGSSIRFKAVSLPEALIEKTTQLMEFSGMDSHTRPIAVIVGAGIGVRAYPVDGWSEFIDGLPTGIPVVLVGSKSEYSRSARITTGSKSGERIFNMCGATDAAGLAGLLARCSLIVGTDTGPLHVAAMVGARCLGLYYGSMFYRQTGPYGAGHIVIAPKTSGYPCPEEEMSLNEAQFTAVPAKIAIRVANTMITGGEFEESAEWQTLESSFENNRLIWRHIDHIQKPLTTVLRVD